MQQVQALRESIEKLLGGEERGAGGGQLERERQLVEASAELDHGGLRRESRIEGSCPGNEQRLAVALG